MGHHACFSLRCLPVFLIGETDFFLPISTVTFQLLVLTLPEVYFNEYLKKKKKVKKPKMRFSLCNNDIFKST